MQFIRGESGPEDFAVPLGDCSSGGTSACALPLAKSIGFDEV